MEKGSRFHGCNFSEKVSGTWPAYKRANSGHENATFYGFIMRMVDQGATWDET